MGTTAYLGLGSNLGDRLASLEQAARLLEAEQGVDVVRSSSVYASDPVGGPPQPEYLNAVVEVMTDLGPDELLAACQRVESTLGRVRAERWGPRTIDIDVLAYDELERHDPELTLPHPRLLERAFVLVPLLEVAPELRLPDGRRVTLSSSAAGVRRFASPLEAPA